jgi:hypothetical protein
MVILINCDTLYYTVGHVTHFPMEYDISDDHYDIFMGLHYSDDIFTTVEDENN